jgi:ribose transport system permease protein
MTMIIVSGGIDLSVGSVVALCSVVGATLLAKGHSAAESIAVTILVGALVGLTNGAVIAGLRMLPFIVTLGMMGIARGAAKWLAGNQTVNSPESPVNNIMALHDPLHLLPLPWGVWIAAGLAVIMAVIMRQTIFGRYVFAIGSNEATARLCGIRVQIYKAIIYTFAGLFFGLAGLMQLSRLTQGDPTVAIGLELDIIAAVVIGGASLNGGTGSILGSMIGALIMAVLRNGSNQMGWPNYMQEIIIGIVIILAVGLDRLRQSRANR